MPTLTEKLDLWGRIRHLMPQGDKSSPLYEVITLIDEARASKTSKQIEAEVKEEVEKKVGLYFEPSIDDYVEPTLGRFERNKTDKRKKHREDYDYQAQQIIQTAQNDYGLRLKKAREQAYASKGPSQESLRAEAIELIHKITSGKPFAFRGSELGPEQGALKSELADPAKLFERYFTLEDQISKAEHEKAANTIESMLEILRDHPLYGGLIELKNVLSLTQARALIDAGHCIPAIQSTIRIEGDANQGEAHYIRGVAYLKLGPLGIGEEAFSQAAAEFKEACRKGILQKDHNGTVIYQEDAYSKVREVFMAQAGSGMVEQAVKNLVSTSEIFRPEEKIRFLLGEVETLMEEGPQNYDLALKVAEIIDDEIAQGHASNKKGEIYYARHQFHEATLEFGKAYARNPEIDGIYNKLAQSVKGQIEESKDVAQAVNDLDSIIETEKSKTHPFSEIKGRLLLAEVDCLIAESDLENLDLAYIVAEHIDDKVTNGKVSYKKGEIKYKRGEISGKLEDYEEADRHSRNAFVIAQDIPDITKQLKAIYTRLAEKIEERDIDYSQIGPIGGGEKGERSLITQKYKAAIKRYQLNILGNELPNITGAEQLIDEVLALFLRDAQEAPANQTPFDLMSKARQGIEPIIRNLNDDERMVFAGSLHFKAYFNIVKSGLAKNDNERMKLIHDAIGFDREDPCNIGYIGQSLAVMPRKMAYRFLAQHL